MFFVVLPEPYLTKVKYVVVVAAAGFCLDYDEVKFYHFSADRKLKDSA